MKLEDIEDHGTMLYIRIPDKKSPRSFTITNNSQSGYDYLDLYRRYINLRPTTAHSTRFFLQYINGKCTTCVVGINTFGKIPKCIAEFLKLSDVNAYTGHCFKATRAALKLDFQRGLIGYCSNSIDDQLMIVNSLTDNYFNMNAPSTELSFNER